jgi:ABC-type antimicrobial peptide transport system permease subunit
VTRKANTPPKLATKFLHYFLRFDLAEDVSGDLAERFSIYVEEKSLFRARVDYWYQVFSYLRPFAIKKISYTNRNFIPMFQSYFVTSVRSMKKNKLHAIINIVGLSVGMTVAMIIGLWIKDELSYEKHFDNYSKIGRVLQHVTNNGEVGTWWSIPWPLAEELRKNYGDNFTQVVLTTSADPEVLSYEDKNLTQTGIFAEPDFTELFSLQMIRGTRKALTDQSSVLISESLAKTYFDDSDPIGKIMTLSKDMTVHVAGVYKDIPEQSEFKDTHFIASWQLLYNKREWIKNMREPWRPNAFSLYVAIADNHSFDQVSANIKDAKLKNVSAELAKKKPALFVHPMSRWHLYSRFRDGQQVGGLITYVWLFATIAGFVVLMACINFMNLSTAQSEKRSREVGIRKAIGSFRSQLITQFFCESIVTALFSFALALLVVQLTLPAFNLLADKRTALPWTDLTLWLSGVGLCFFIGIISGSYPALYLSSITPGKALKGVLKVSRFSTLPRKVMVVVQFAVSVIMIIGTAVVFQQLQYAKERPIGYDPHGLIAVPSIGNELHNHIDALKEELIGGGTIADIAESDAPTTETSSSTSAIDWNGKDPDLSVDFTNTGVAHDYGKTIGWQIVKGRDFSKEFLSDSTGMVINESAAMYMNMKEPVEEVVRWYKQEFHIVGVAKDIVVGSPFEPVRPTFYFINPGPCSFVLFRVTPGQPIHDALSQIQNVYKKYNPAQPFDFRLIDQDYARKFGNEERVGKLAAVFTSLAIFISCLGIFGLSSFVAEQRTKEIGIRKVHGASVFQLWKMVSTDFVTLVLTSCLIALPLAYYLAGKWVNRYDYHVTVSWLILVFAALCIVVITLVTVSWHTLHAAKMNPVKSLRSE